MEKKKSTINNFEQQKFEKFYSEWWDLDGPFKILHLFNYLRIDFIKRNFFERNEFYKKASLKNLKVLYGIKYRFKIIFNNGFDL